MWNEALKVEEFLDSYFYKEYLQDLLEEANLSTVGQKKDLIKRLREKTNYDIFQLIAYLGKEDLKGACRDLGLRVGGTRDDLDSRVFEEVVSDWSEEEFVSEMKKASKNHGLSEGQLKELLGSLYAKYERGIQKLRIPPAPTKGYDEINRMIEEAENTEQTRILQELIKTSYESGEIIAEQRSRLLKKLVEVSKKFKDQEASLKIGPFDIFSFKRKRQ